MCCAFRKHFLHSSLLKVRSRSVPLLLLGRISPKRDLQSFSSLFFVAGCCALCGLIIAHLLLQELVGDHVSCIKSKYQQAWKSHLPFLYIYFRMKVFENQNWGPGLFQSFFWESPQKPPCFFLFASSQSKTSGFFTWKKFVHQFWPIYLSFVWG